MSLRYDWLPKAIRSTGVKKFSAGISIMADIGGQTDTLDICRGVRFLSLTPVILT